MWSLEKITSVAPAISAIVAALGFIVAVMTLVKSLMEYIRQNSIKRFEKFQELEKDFKDNNDFTDIIKLLENDDKGLKDISAEKRMTFLGFYERIALIHNSKIFNEEVIHYMFGYYAIRTFESENFWYGINKNSLYWSLFCQFADKMKKIEKKIGIAENKAKYDLRLKF